VALLFEGGAASMFVVFLFSTNFYA